ncbi:MAG: hypothetical protein HOL01_11090, partial [Planctomycetaceae bacterium]|nr:hypothetical protein [Planctomycetaceae bacterium]
PGEQPPHHYRLLGLKLFTSDRGKIDAAAEKAINRVRKQAGEKHKAVAARLIGMIDTARSCLLNAENQSAYDDKLRASGGIAPVMGDTLPEPMELNQVAQSDKSRSAGASPKKVSPLVISAAGGVVGVVLAIVFAFSGWFGGEEDHAPIPDGQQLASNNEASNPQSNPPESEPPPSISETQPNDATVPGEANPRREVVDEPPSTDTNTTKTDGNETTKTDDSPVVSTNTDTAPADSPVVTPQTQPKPTPRVVNLLEKVDLKRDAISGSWAIEDGVLSSGGGKSSQFRITDDAPKEYELRLTVTRTGTVKQASTFGMILAGGERLFSVSLDIPRGWTSGLQMIDGKLATENETTRQAGAAPLLKIGVESQIVCRVDDKGVKVTVNGKPIIDWEGDFSRLSPHPHLKLKTDNHLSIASYGPFKISKIELRRLDVSGPLPTPRVVVNLLKHIDPEKHAVHGEWLFDGETLVSKGGKYARLQIPYLPPSEYELHVTASRTTAARDPGLNIGLVAAGRNFAAMLEHARRYNGLHTLDEKPLTENGAVVSKAVLKTRQPVEIICKVTKSGVKVSIDGRTLFDWKGEFSRLSPYVPFFKVPNERQLWIGGDSPFRFTKIELRSLAVTQSQPTPRVVNLLPRVDPDKASIGGKWTFENGSLISPVGRSPKLRIADSVPDQYDLRFTVERLSGNDCIFVGLPVDGHQIPCFVDLSYGLPSPYTGLAGPQPAPDGHKGELLKTNVPIDMEIAVRKGGIAIKAGAKVVYEWQGDSSKFKFHSAWSIPQKQALYIGASRSKFRITKLELINPNATGPSDRLAIPEIAAQQAAEKLIRDLFKEDYASLKRVTEKLKLAKKLLEQGQESDDDLVARYVLLQEAKRLAIDAGDTALTMDAVDSIVWHFDVDPSAETMAVLRKLAGSVRFPANGKEVADAAFDFAKSANEAGQMETALEFLKMASSTATKFRQRPLAKEILDFRRNIIALKQRDDDAAAASQTLADNPDDPKANLEWGSYLCFIKQDWTAGLPLLAKSDNAGLTAVVELEIAAPTEAEQMKAVADAWWNLAQSKKSNRIQKSQWLGRAGHWYGKSVGDLTGLQKTLVEKRIKEIAATTTAPRGK